MRNTVDPLLQQQSDWLKLLTIPISPELREALLALKIFQNSGPRRNGRFIAILSVDCIWCRVQFAANRSLLHAADIRYALTSMDRKYASLIDVELMDEWNAAPGADRLRLQDARSQRLFHGLTDSAAAKTPAEARAIEEQRQHAARVMDLLDKAYTPRGSRVTGYPVTFWVDANLSVLRLVSVGYSSGRYYWHLSLPFPRYADEEGRGMVRRFLELTAPGGSAVGGRLGDDVWQALGELQNVPIGGEPFDLRGASAGRHIYVLFDPSDARSRLLWHRFSLMQFYAKVHWTPVPDLADSSSIEACVHLGRCADASASAAEVERLFMFDMLGYQPKPLVPEQSDDEGAELGKAVALAEHLQASTRLALPIIVWKAAAGGVYWTGGEVVPRELLAIVEASERFTV